jgi:hypothetical protein
VNTKKKHFYSNTCATVGFGGSSFVEGFAGISAFAKAISKP